MVVWLPARSQIYATLVPCVNAYEMIRAGQFGPAVTVHYDIPYTTFFCSAMILLGLAMCRRVHKYLVVS